MSNLGCPLSNLTLNYSIDEDDNSSSNTCDERNESLHCYSIKCYFASDVTSINFTFGGIYLGNISIQPNVEILINHQYIVNSSVLMVFNLSSFECIPSLNISFTRMSKDNLEFTICSNKETDTSQSTSTIDGSKELPSISTIDDNKESQSTSTIDDDKESQSTSTVDEGKESQSTSTVDKSKTSQSTSTTTLSTIISSSQQSLVFAIIGASATIACLLLLIATSVTVLTLVLFFRSKKHRPLQQHTESNTYETINTSANLFVETVSNVNGGSVVEVGEEASSGQNLPLPPVIESNLMTIEEWRQQEGNVPVSNPFYASTFSLATESEPPEYESIDEVNHRYKLQFPERIESCNPDTRSLQDIDSVQRGSWTGSMDYSIRRGGSKTTRKKSQLGQAHFLESPLTASITVSNFIYSSAGEIRTPSINASVHGREDNGHNLYDAISDQVKLDGNQTETHDNMPTYSQVNKKPSKENLTDRVETVEVVNDSELDANAMPVYFSEVNISTEVNGDQDINREEDPPPVPPYLTMEDNEDIDITQLPKQDIQSVSAEELSQEHFPSVQISFQGDISTVGILPQEGIQLAAHISEDLMSKKDTIPRKHSSLYSPSPSPSPSP